MRPAPSQNGKQRLYKASWFSLETSLHDGTTFTETIDDLIRQRSFTNPRGKSKSKTRTHSLLGMRFAYPQKVYGDASPLGATGCAKKFACRRRPQCGAWK